jgi:signal peptidase I
MESAGQSRQCTRILVATDVLRSIGSVRIRALGTSMLPSIWPGDILNIQHCHPADLAFGDVVLLSQGDRLVVHRVVAPAETAQGVSWITRGDAMAQNDPPGQDVEILGKVLSIDRRGQTIIPGRKRSLCNRALGLALSRSRRLLNFVLWLIQKLQPELREETAPAVSGC